ncbi:MAG: hypothetical protein ACYDEX_17575 [Mobilitalea sp.]
MDISGINIIGYDLLGENNKEGIRYAWKKDNCDYYLESAAFINRRKEADERICGYTTSVSSGCILSSFKRQCSFCRTGNRLPFGGLLSYTDIVKQNVFMVLTDMHCSNNSDLALRQREFAYMGQGEPGYSYSQVRLAIELTNRIMETLGQKVYRHIFATCGVLEAINEYKEDVVHFFTKRVTLHFSLHATEKRDMLMPINLSYSYKDIIAALDKVFDETGEKPCVGIILFQDFMPNDRIFSYTNTYQNVAEIFSELNPEKCRISLCEYNGSDDICSCGKYPAEEAMKIVKLANDLGFEVKLFSSFGKEKHTACGMLAGKEPDRIASAKWYELEKETDRLIAKYQ